MIPVKFSTSWVKKKNLACELLSLGSIRKYSWTSKSYFDKHIIKIPLKSMV